MAGSVFDYYEDPEEQANGRGFAALLSAMPSVSSDDPDQEGSPAPTEASAATTAGAPVAADAGMDQAPSGQSAPAGPSSPDVDRVAQSYGGDAPPALKQYGDHSADYAARTAQKAGEDPSKFKPSGWRRALAGIAGGMVAAGSRDPAAGLRIGEGVLNAPLDRAKAQWATQEAPLDAKIAADQAEDAQTYRTNQGIEQQGRLQESHARNQYYGQLSTEHAADFAALAAARKNALVGFTPDDPDDQNSLGTGTTADGRTVKGAQPPAWYQDKWNKNPANKGRAGAEEGLARLKAMDEAGIKTTPEQRVVIAGGGRPTTANRNSFRIPSAESEKYNDWKTTFARDNKRPPNAAEIAAFGHNASGGLTKTLGDRIEATKGAGFRKAQSDFGIFKDPGAYQADLQLVQNEYEQRLESATGQEIPHVDITVDKGGKVDWGSANQGDAKPAPAATPTAAPAPAPAATQAVKVASGQTVKVGDPVTDGRGRTGTITGINPQTGKPKVKWSGAQ